MKQSETMHATCVCVAGNGILIIGKAGAGKSGLALQLMAYGATLVADDLVDISTQDGNVIASSPRPKNALIEARGVGLLHAQLAPSTPLYLAIDLDQIELARLPVKRSLTVMGSEIPLLYDPQTPHFAASVMQLMRAGRSIP